MFSPDMTGSPYPTMGSGAVNDIANHEAMDMPEPGHSPAMKHSVAMAGDTLPNPFDSGELGSTAEKLPNPFMDNGPKIKKPRKPKPSK